MKSIGIPHRRSVLPLCLLAMALAGTAAPAAEQEAARKADPKPGRFDAAMKAFATADAAQPVQPGGVVFVGSSSIRMWDLKESFPGLKALNRGFGGSQTSDVNHFLDQTVLRYRPRLVVFFCGVNDIAYGKPPAQVLADFATFRRKLFEKLPETRLIVLALKPSPRRVKFLPLVKQTNRLIQEAVKEDSRITFVQEAFDSLMNPDCTIRGELFLPDQIHMNQEGYRVWTNALEIYLEQPAAPQ